MNKTRKATGVTTDADLAQAKRMVQFQKANEEFAQAKAAIEAKYGIVFVFQIGGISLVPSEPQT